MPDLNAAESSAPAAPFDTPQVKDPATVLEDAADLLLIHGRARGTARGAGGSYCVIAALSQADGNRGNVDRVSGPLRLWLSAHDEVQVGRMGSIVCPVLWNDHTEDDFDIIDTLRHVAKELRNQAVA